MNRLRGIRMVRRLLWGVLAVVLGGVILFWVATLIRPDLAPRFPRGGSPAKFGPVADFTLADQLGRPTRLADLKGRPWVADFIFTRCSGPCPMMTSRMAGLIQSLGATPLRFVSFSVDPEYDTPEVLKAYAAQFGADPERWRFLTGPRETIQGLSVDSFRMAMGDAPVDTATVLIDIAHSTRFVLVDAGGEIRGYYDGTDDEGLARLAHDIRILTRGR